MTQELSQKTLSFVRETEADARKAYRWLRKTHTISPSATIGFAVRVPGEDKVAILAHPGLWADDVDTPITEVLDFAGKPYLGAEFIGADQRFLPIFKVHPDLQAISHVHTPSLGAYSQAHAELPLLYVPNRRFRFTQKLPVYINRRQTEVDFIL
jgi:hypothetical protein